MAIRDELLDELLGDKKTAEDLFGQEGLLKNLSKRLMERLLEGEWRQRIARLRNS
jgi:putative transposase